MKPPSAQEASHESYRFIYVACLVAVVEMSRTHATAALLFAVVAATSAWYVQGWRMEGQVHKAQAALAKLKTDTAEQRARSSASALNTYALMESTKDAAIQAATARAEKNRADAAGLRRQLDSLHHDLAAVPSTIAAASRAAVDEYAAAATVVFEQCVGRYAALAEIADRHANDAAACRAAWPVNPSRPYAATAP